MTTYALTTSTVSRSFRSFSDLRFFEMPQVSAVR
jgi:hypothetical protein